MKKQPILLVADTTPIFGSYCLNLVLRVVLFIVLLSLPCLKTGAEEVFVSKGGQLKKAVKKLKCESADDLTISGTLNKKDIAYLESLPNLRKLEFAKATYARDKKEAQGSAPIPVIASLESLVISPEWASNAVIDLDGLRKLRYLKVPLSNSIINSNVEVYDSIHLTGGSIPGKFIGPVIVKRVITDGGSNPSIFSFFPGGDVLSVKFAKDDLLVLTDYSPNYPTLLRECDVLDNESMISYPLETLMVPENIKWINDKAFNRSDIERIIFSTQLPSLSKGYGGDRMKFPLWLTVIVPEGSYGQYKDYISTPIYEAGVKHSLSLVAQEGGDIKKQLAKENMYAIDTLKISGKIYSEDLDLLSKASNLRVLDISDVEIVKTPDELAAENKLIESTNRQMVREYLMWIKSLTLYNIKLAEKKYYDRQAGLEFMAALFGGARQQANSRGDIKSKMEGSIYQNMEAALDNESKNLASPAEEANRMKDRYAKVVNRISEYYGKAVDIARVVEVIDFERVNLTENEKKMTEGGIDVIDNLERGLKGKLKGKARTIKNEIPEVVGSLPHLTFLKVKQGVDVIPDKLRSNANILIMDNNGKSLK